MPLARIFNVKHMSFNVIRENKILAKVSEFTVYLKLFFACSVLGRNLFVDKHLL